MKSMRFSKKDNDGINQPGVKWYIHVILLGPATGLLITILLNLTLGCSEYTQYQSELCNKIEAFLGLNLYWGLFGIFYLFFFLCIFTVPAAIFVYIYRAIDRRQKE